MKQPIKHKPNKFLHSVTNLIKGNYVLRPIWNAGDKVNFEQIISEVECSVFLVDILIFVHFLEDVRGRVPHKSNTKTQLFHIITASV